ncbi:MAG: hypothetical protein V1755_14025 [Chloroflexota bacterium]
MVTDWNEMVQEIGHAIGEVYEAHTAAESLGQSACHEALEVLRR